MSPTDRPHALDSDARQAQRPPRRKAVLFCPDCGHESPTTGDWIVQPGTSDQQWQRLCPRCDAVIQTRPAVEASRARRPVAYEQSAELAAAIGTLGPRALLATLQIYTGWLDSVSQRVQP